jgi:hypothetical protein
MPEQAYGLRQAHLFNDMLRRGQIANMLAAELNRERLANEWLDLSDARLAEQDEARAAFWELYDDDDFLPDLPTEWRAKRIQDLVGLGEVG